MTQILVRKGDFAFAEASKPTNLEQRIAAELWRWKASPKDGREAAVTAQAFAGAIEFFLCGVFRVKNSAPSAGWWCDGVDGLLVDALGDRSFLICGAACWAQSSHNSPFYDAPFELEFHFSENGSLSPERIVVRFGRLDKAGKIQKVSQKKSWPLIKNGPQCDQDWAFAVELT